MNPSLLLIPDRYKASKLYSQIPDSGAGDLAFTRANDTATRVNSAGLIEKVRTNLVTYSEDFANAAWTKNSATVTSNTQANPINGELTADTITATGSVGYISSAAFAMAAVPYTISMYAKKSNVDWVSIEASDGIANSSKSWYNISNGTLGTTGGTYTILNRTITNAGNGWYRLTLTFAVTAATNYFFVPFFVASDGALSVSGNAGFGFGAQAETSDFGATPYIPTTTAAVSVGPVANIPRIDYTGGGCGKLLLEPQRTNLLTFSEQFNNAAYTKTNLTITANTTAAPDGTTSADTATTTSSVSELYQSSSTAVTTATCSLFVKKSTHKYFGISINGTNNFDSRYQGVFDLDLGTVFQENNSTTPLTNRSSKIESYGNGWYRIIVTATFATSANAFVVFQQSNNVPTIPSDNLAWNNSSIGSTFVWGAQVEAGSYVSSYIPTLGASVTRSADAASKTGISSLIGQTSGTIYLEMQYDASIPNLSGGVDQPVIALQNTTNNVLAVLAQGQSAGNIIAGLSITSSSVQAVLLSSAQSSGVKKIAFVYRTNYFALFVNGVKIAEDLLGTPAAVPNLYFGSYDGTGTLFKIEMKSFALYSSDLSDTELISLTAL